jgi:hypothetical protein
MYIKATHPYAANIIIYACAREVAPGWYKVECPARQRALAEYLVPKLPEGVKEISKERR